MRSPRCALLLLLLVGCIDERPDYVADPLVSIGSVSCHIAGAQVVIDSTFDVRLEPGQVFHVEHTAALGSAKANVYQFYGCNDWKMMQTGCVRLDDQPETNPVSLHMTDNITSGTLGDSVKIEVTGIVESDDVVIEASRVLTCLR